jgi:hypothetical protein
MRHLRTIALPLSLFSISCADTGRDAGAGEGLTSLGDEAGSETGDDQTDTGESGFDEGMTPMLDLGGAGDETPEEEECASVEQAAEATKLPADIIVVVDNSGSMEAEADAVQANLNAFSQQIIASGVDVRVTLISSYPSEGHGICVDPPLGSGGCPNQDTNQPLFLHVDQFVASHDALEQVLDHFDTWGPTTRPDATTHVFVVTDDESNIGPNNFDTQFRALAPHFDDYKLHAVASLSNCDEAAAIGDTYIELAGLTGGVLADLCDQDFAPVFDALSTEVIGGSLLACEFVIPPPPPGETFDPDEVNVEFSDGINATTIGRVDDAAGCAQVSAGWYYDDPVNPTTILMCPQTCDVFQGLTDASVTISFGCATVPAG